jgi:hypothetical protein
VYTTHYTVIMIEYDSVSSDYQVYDMLVISMYDSFRNKYYEEKDLMFLLNKL